MSDSKKSRRAHERLRVPPMYTSVTACRDVPAVAGSEEMLGHVYDISEAGVRIELDEALQPGEPVALSLDLPGSSGSVAASARVVWVHDQLDDPGPRRMALRFTEFGDDADRERLVAYLSRERDRQAA
jgi:hypothetical protein